MRVPPAPLKLSRSEKLLQAGLIRPSDRIQDSYGLRKLIFINEM
jgi:hypothetical protein